MECGYSVWAHITSGNGNLVEVVSITIYWILAAFLYSIALNYILQLYLIGFFPSF